MKARGSSSIDWAPCVIVVHAKEITLTHGPGKWIVTNNFYPPRSPAHFKLYIKFLQFALSRGTTWRRGAKRSGKSSLPFSFNQCGPARKTTKCVLRLEAIRIEILVAPQGLCLCLHLERKTTDTRIDSLPLSSSLSRPLSFPLCPSSGGGERDQD